MEKTTKVRPKRPRYVVNAIVRDRGAYPVPDAVVILIAHEADGRRAIAEAAADDEGRVRFVLTASAFRDTTSAPLLSFEVLAPEGRRLLFNSEHTVIWTPARGDRPVVLELGSAEPAGSHVSLDDAWVALRRTPSETLVQWLAEHDVRTLADLRKVQRDLRKLAEGPERDDARILSSLAGLSVIEAPAGVYVRLVQSGLSTIRSIVETDTAAIEEALSDETTPREIRRIRGDAARIDWRTANVIVSHRSRPRIAGAEDPLGLDDLIGASRCQCGCASALSAQAYLAHLLRVALRVLRYLDRTIDIVLLQDQLHQPLRDLPASCESSEVMVSQARIAVEVLRQRFNDRIERAWYLEAAYLRALPFLNLSYDELRRAFASGDAKVRLALLDARQLSTGDPAEAVYVDELFHELPPIGGAGATLTEAWLQDAFGLRSTLLSPTAAQNGMPRALMMRREGWRARWLREDSAVQRPLGELPIVDPHLIAEIDLVDRTPTTPRVDDVQSWTAIDFLKRREEEWTRASNEIMSYVGPPPAGTTRAERLKRMFEEFSQPVFQLGLAGSAIPLPPLGFRVGNDALDYARLELIDRALQQGIDASVDLQLFGIDAETVQLIVGYVARVEAGLPVTQMETGTYSRAIESHVKRVGFWPEWVAQERRSAAGTVRLFLDPVRFRARVRGGDAPDPRWSERPGLAERAERARWEELLDTRARTLESLRSELDQIVERIEHGLLPELRDEIIRVEGADAERLTDAMQVDFKASGCLRTTRVTQAIQTVQGVLFGTRNGLLDDPAWSMVEREFDALWVWIGTFDKWRAAIAVFLYPERLLRPSLLGDTSPGFADLLQALRDADPIAVPDAARAHDVFAGYLNDVIGLRIDAVARRGLATRPHGLGRIAYYLLARPAGPTTGRVYASVAVDEGGEVSEQSWWRRLDAMSGGEVFGLAVSASFLVAITGHRQGGTRSLAAWRQPLADAALSTEVFLDSVTAWEGPFDLPLPANVNTYDAVAVRPDPLGGLTTIVIEANENRIYAAQLNADASGWSGPFRSQTNRSLWKELGEPLGPAANEATFACRGSGLAPDAVTDERHVIAADVDGDGADEIIAFRDSEGFWAMKLVNVGAVQRWTPMTTRGVEGLDFRIPPLSPGGGRYWFTVAGDFDGDRVAEIVGVLDTTQALGAQNYALDLIARKWTVAAGAGTFAVFGDTTFGYSHPRQTPIDCVVGRFTQFDRDEIAITFAQTQGNQMADIVIFTLVNGAWRTVIRTAASIGAGAIARDGRAVAGQFGDNSGHQLLLQNAGAEGSEFLTLTFDRSSQAWLPLTTLSVGAVSDGPRLLAGDFDDDGLDELVLADGGSLIRFFKLDGVRWTEAGQVNAGGPIQSWASGRFEADGRLHVIVSLVASPTRGLVIEWNTNQNRPQIVAQPVELTRRGRPARHIVAGRFNALASREAVASLGDGSTFYVFMKEPRALVRSDLPEVRWFKPMLVEPFSVLTPAADGRTLMSIDRFRQVSRAAFDANTENRPRNRAYLEEAFFFLIVEIALRHQSAGNFGEALAWLRLVARLRGSTIDVGTAFLDLDSLGTLPLRSSAGRDPLDAHTIARARPGAYTRFVIETSVRLLSGAGDSEFAIATPQSIAKAREFYLSALALLNAHPHAGRLDDCDPERVAAEAASDAGASIGDRIDQEARVESLTIVNPDGGPVFMANNGLNRDMWLEFAAGRRHVPLPSYSYCIPPSSTLLELKRRIELNLYRLRNCMDVNGNEMVLAPIGQAAEASPANRLQAMSLLQPLPYRYTTLIERAKLLVEMARQIESSMLAFIESAERRRYDVLAASRDLSLARASQQLRAVQAQQAAGEVGLATLQRDRASDQVDRYQRLMRAGLSNWEKAGLISQWGAYGFKQYAAVSTALEEASWKGWVEGVLTWGGGNMKAIAAAQADAASALGQVQFSQAEFERRQQGWQAGLDDAIRDRQMGEAQIQISEARLRGAQVEQVIADLQTSYATDAVTLLTTRSVANQALYEWMASVLEGIYRFFLQQATTMARLAELQLAFERQETSSEFVKRDYWTANRAGVTSDVTSIPNGSDALKGLTGAARLLRDIYQLDQFAFTRNKRKEVLTERISLARLDPVAFEQLRTTGRMVFDTPMEQFDSRSPGHYLRLIRRVRMTVVALVSPTDGIRATLSNAGVSRVVVPAESGFRAVSLQRGYDQLTFTASSSASTAIEMDPDPQLLAQFEGSGVDTRWLLDMPWAANTFAPASLADVIVSIEYTALFDSYLKAKTLSELPPTVTRQRVFSLRYEFPDSWYDLHNTGAQAAPVETTFTTSRGDFPPNVTNLRVKQIALFVQPKAGSAPRAAIGPIDIEFLGFAASGSANFVGGACTTEAEGLGSTRRANGASWLPILSIPEAAIDGTWQLRFASAHRVLFAGDGVEDILLAVSFEAARPPWPAELR